MSLSRSIVPQEGETFEEVIYKSHLI